MHCCHCIKCEKCFFGFSYFDNSVQASAQKIFDFDTLYTEGDDAFAVMASIIEDVRAQNGKPCVILFSNKKYVFKKSEKYEAFLQLGWTEDLVINRALNSIINSHIGILFRQNKELKETEFKLPPTKECKTKTIKLEELTPEQRKALENAGIL